MKKVDSKGVRGSRQGSGVLGVGKVAGRPNKYDHEFMVECLRDYEGKSGGLMAAWKKIRTFKGYKKVSRMTVVFCAGRAGIYFAAGRPRSKKKTAA
jgi:hypothetical protein